MFSSFLHPGLAALGLGLATVPVVIHLLNRRRFRRIRWAAMDFLLAAHRKSVRRLRLEQIVLLAVRCLLVSLIGMGLARPFLSASALAGLGESRRHHVILIDDSLSTRAPAADGRAVFDHLRQVAEALIENYPVEDTVSLITLASPATAVLRHGAYDRQLALDRLAEVTVTQRGTDLAGGLRLAEEVLGASELPAPNRELVLLTDGARSAWRLEEQAGEQGPTGMAAKVARESALTVIQATAAVPENLAITRLGTDARLVGTLLPVPMQVEVGNFGGQRASDVQVQVLLDGLIARTLELPAVEAGERSTLYFRVQFGEPGEHLVEAVIVSRANDALTEDNRRALVLNVTDRARILLVDGEPSGTRFESQTGYLSTALAPRTAEQRAALLEPRVITEAELAGEPLGDYGMVVLCNVRRLSGEQWSRLREWVAEGRMVAVFLGDNVLLENYRDEGFAGGEGVLTAAPEGAAFPQAVVEAGTNEVTFRHEELAHPMVREFAAHAESGLFLARTRQYMKLGETRGEAGRTYQTILSFSDGAPALVERSVGRGTSLLCTTTANMEWTNLPAKGDYVSLMWNLVTYAWPAVAEERQLTVGASLRHPLTAREYARPCTFSVPGGEVVAAAILPDGDTYVAEMPMTDSPGVYQLETAAGTRRFAVNSDAAEADLRTIGGAELQGSIGEEFDLFVDEMPIRRPRSAMLQRELGWHFLYLAGVLAVLEPLLAMWFGHHR